MTEETKRCPFCREEIHAEAIKCKHCGTMLDETTGSPFGAPDLSKTVHDLTEGMSLGHGRYRILRELGRGGMGIVYLAHDTNMAIEVAIKIHLLAPGLYPGAVRGLRDESTLQSKGGC